MLNCEVAKAASRALWLNQKDNAATKNYKELVDFITSVEELLKNNSIKQTPALFKPYEIENKKTS